MKAAVIVAPSAFRLFAGGGLMRNKARFGVSFVATFLVLSPLPAANAAECGPQRLSASVDLVLPPGGVPLAPVTLVGQPKLMIVDTGGYVGMLFPAAVRQLGLETGVSSTGVITVNGVISHSVTLVSDFGIGRLHAANYKFIVESGKDSGDIADDQPSGILAADILQNYDADFDFGARKLNLIDSDHCKGKVVYWRAPSLAIIPFHLDKSFHIIFPVLVDGKKMDAMLDTGASVTIMNFNTAKSVFHVDEKSPDVEKVGQLKGASYTSDIYRRRFKTIAFGDVVINDPAVTLLPDMIKSVLPQDTTPIGSLLPDSNRPRGLQDIVLGMSTLSNLHVYIAYQERKLYITPSTPPQ